MKRRKHQQTRKEEEKQTGLASYTGQQLTKCGKEEGVSTPFPIYLSIHSIFKPIPNPPQTSFVKSDHKSAESGLN